MKTRKQLIYFFAIFSLVIFSLLAYEQIMYSNTQIICGKIYKQEKQTRGGYSIYYKFDLEGIVHKGAVGTSFLKKIPLDSLKKLDCIKIECSNYSTFFNRIIDKRVLK